jgi:hypothetical protein
MSDAELVSLRAEQQDAAWQAQETINIGEELLDRVRVVAHLVEERVQQVMDAAAQPGEQPAA